MYSQPEGEGQPKKRPRKARPLSANVDTIRASGTLGEASHCVHSAHSCPAELFTGRVCTPHLILVWLLIVCTLPALVLLNCSQAGSALLMLLCALCLQMCCCTAHRQLLHSSSHCVHSACSCPAELSTGSVCTPHLIVCILPADVLLHCSQAGSALLMSLCAFCLQISCCTVHRQLLHSSSHCVHSACRCPAALFTGRFCTPHLIVCVLPAMSC